MRKFLSQSLRRAAIIPALCISGLAFSQAPPQLASLIKANDIAGVKGLLTKSNINSVDEEGDPLLMNATLYVSVNMLETLLKKGADDPNAKK